MSIYCIVVTLRVHDLTFQHFDVPCLQIVFFLASVSHLSLFRIDSNEVASRVVIETRLFARKKGLRLVYCQTRIYFFMSVFSEYKSHDRIHCYLTKGCLLRKKTYVTPRYIFLCFKTNFRSPPSSCWCSFGSNVTELCLLRSQSFDAVVFCPSAFYRILCILLLSSVFVSLVQTVFCVFLPLHSLHFLGLSFFQFTGTF